MSIAGTTRSPSPNIENLFVLWSNGNNNLIGISIDLATETMTLVVYTQKISYRNSSQSIRNPVLKLGITIAYIPLIVKAIPNILFVIQCPPVYIYSNTGIKESVYVNIFSLDIHILMSFFLYIYILILYYFLNKIYFFHYWLTTSNYSKLYSSIFCIHIIPKNEKYPINNGFNKLLSINLTIMYKPNSITEPYIGSINASFVCIYSGTYIPSSLILISVPIYILA